MIKLLIVLDYQIWYQMNAKGYHLMNQYANDLIFRFTNIDENMRNERKPVEKVRRVTKKVPASLLLISWTIKLVAKA